MTNDADRPLRRVPATYRRRRENTTVWGLTILLVAGLLLMTGLFYAKDASDDRTAVLSHAPSPSAAAARPESPR